VLGRGGHTVVAHEVQCKFIIIIIIIIIHN